MVTYEQAKQFREASGAPLTWDDAFPPLPRDRIEFTRLILETAEEAGIGLLDWTKQIGFEDPENRWRTFQQIIRQYTRRQTFQGIPKVGANRWIGGMHINAERTLRWGEYVEQLEEDYYEPWRTSWVFGFAEGSEDRIIAQLKEWLAHRHVGFSRGKQYSDALKYPDADRISGSEVIAEYLSPKDGRAMAQDMVWYFGLELPLVEERFLGVGGDWTLNIPLFVGGITLLGVVYGAIRGWYSGWWLFLFVPILAIACLFAWLSMGNFYRLHWLDRNMTFRQLARRITTLKTSEWTLLQRQYWDL